MQERLLGKIGISSRNKLEFDLQMDLTGMAIKKTWQERKLTEELGKLIGVQKAQISRLVY